MGGGPIPILAESHQPPGLAANTGSGGAQLWRSVERESQMSARWVSTVTGRWSKMYSPRMRRGSSAPFLSSGARTMPSRSADRKSLVSAKESPGPPGPNKVYAITQLSNPPDPKSSRGSSDPRPHVGEPGQAQAVDPHRPPS